MNGWSDCVKPISTVVGGEGGGGGGGGEEEHNRNGVRVAKDVAKNMT